MKSPRARKSLCHMVQRLLGASGPAPCPPRAERGPRSALGRGPHLHAYYWTWPRAHAYSLGRSKSECTRTLHKSGSCWGKTPAYHLRNILPNPRAPSAGAVWRWAAGVRTLHADLQQVVPQDLRRLVEQRLRRGHRGCHVLRARRSAPESAAGGAGALARTGECWNRLRRC